MKTLTLKNPSESISFWRRVRREYRHTEFICHSSAIFKKAWDNADHSLKLRELGETFLEGRYLEFEIAPQIVLFSPKDGGYNPDRIKIRKEFINWNISRLSKKK